MNITLTDVDKNNYEDVCDLSVAEDQYDYVAENMWSLVESKFNPSYHTRCNLFRRETCWIFHVGA